MSIHPCYDIKWERAQTRTDSYASPPRQWTSNSIASPHANQVGVMPPENNDTEEGKVGIIASADPEDILSREVRENVTNGFKLPDADGEVVNFDIKQNMREIRAILATNEEIFERCKISSGND